MQKRQHQCLLRDPKLFLGAMLPECLWCTNLWCNMSELWHTRGHTVADTCPDSSADSSTRPHSADADAHLVADPLPYAILVMAH